MKHIIYLAKPFVLKPYCKKELETVLGVSKYVCRRWLAAIEPKIGKPICGQYSVEQVKIIVETYGLPGQLMDIPAGDAHANPKQNLKIAA